MISLCLVSLFLIIVIIPDLPQKTGGKKAAVGFTVVLRRKTLE